MSQELSVEDRISILLTTILDEGIDNYSQNFTKLIQRLNEFYDTNKVDIINYFTKVIMFIPTKGTIYSNALFNFGKADIINSIFKKLIEELSTKKNSFIFIRSFIFIFGLIHFGALQNELLINFILENIAKKNVNLLQILIRSIFLIYRKNNEYQFLIQSINVIYESGIVDQSDMILDILHTYANSEQEENTGNKFDGFFIKDIIPNNDLQDNDVNMIDSNTENKLTGIDNIFNELNNINYEKIFCPELITRKYIDYKENKTKLISFSDIYYELFLMNNIEAFKDEPNECCKYYLFSLPEIYYNIKDKEQNNNILPYQFIIDNITYASLDLILYPFWTKSDLCYLINFILFILSDKNSFSKIFLQESKEKNIFIDFIIAVISNTNFLEKLSPFQLNNLIIFLYHIISTFPEAKKEILTQIQNILNDESNNYTLLYFTNSFYEKVSNLIKKESLDSEIYFPEKDFTPNKAEAKYNINIFEKISSDVNRKIPFNSFENKSLFENDDQNEALYTFVYCLLNSSKNNSLNKIHEYIELYEDALREIINKNSTEDENDKMKTVLKVIFDLYGHLPLYCNYIIDLFAFKNLLNHITIINFIFTEKLFQKKENGLICSYYDLINNCVENCYTMLTKFDNDFQNLEKSFSKVDENKRKEMRLKIEFYINEVEKLKKQRDVICDKVLEMFLKMLDMSEGLGGDNYKIFLKKVIKDEYGLFVTEYKIRDEWSDKINKLEK